MADSPKHPGGRPPKLTPEIALGIGEAILDGMFRVAAGKLFGISAERIRRWMQQGRRFPDGLYGQFRWVVLEAEAQAEREAVKAVRSAGRTDDARHFEWWLERKFPQRWGKFRGELQAMRKELADLRAEVRRAAADAEDAG